MKRIKPFTSVANRAEKRAAAFTFIELLVILAVITLLAAMLLPVLANTAGGTLRTQCLNNLRQLGVGSTLAANDNNEFLVSAKPQDNDTNTPGNPAFVQYAISSRFTNELAAAGIPIVSNAPCVWCCPDVPDLPCPDTVNYPQWIIGYQYFGGITKWTPLGSADALPGTHSPVKLTQSQPYWCLAADLVAKINGTWGGTESLVTAPPIVASEETWPPHREGTNAIPVGGNEVFVDGSASWCTVETMHNFTSWTANNQMWFYQSTVDITTFGAQQEINILKWNNGN
jgi:type II secretory pathway pseudopilin PulG